ncbi:MAG: hypothetical protein A2137_04790 [Chloroflexi bacterium RBG_16_58_8]|nr:MAG: hypothetical protein A2137_04790 [Chloroflexi bacterium RBG_16_58_8]
MAAVTVWKRPSRTWTAMEPYYRPWSYLDELESWASDMWEGWKPSYHHGYWHHAYPRMDMYEYKDELWLWAELPGLKKEDIDISLEGDCLTIKAEKKAREVPEDARYYYNELCYGTYSRSFTLPYPVDGEKLTATYADGVLEVRLPKAEEAKAKHIEVRVK